MRCTGTDVDGDSDGDGDDRANRRKQQARVGGVDNKDEIGRMNLGQSAMGSVVFLAPEKKVIR